MDSERKAEDGSGAHQSRNNYLRGSLPRPRLLSSGPPTVGSQPPERPRRRSSTDPSNNEQKVQKISRTPRQHLISATSRVESSGVQTSTHRVTADERVPIIAPTRAGAHKSKLPTSTSTRRQNENLPTKKAGNPRTPIKALPIAFRQRVSSILNEGLFNIVNVPATKPSSINTLDDLARWDSMNSLPIPSPSGSPVSQSPAPRSPPTPFTTPIDNNTLLENEVSFPIDRHAKVVREDMGIKKSKNKGVRNSSGNTPNRNPVAPAVDPPVSTPANGLPGLPNPLPLRTLCQNTTSPRPVLPAPSTIFSKSNIVFPKVSRTPGHSWKDEYGSAHLGARDYDLTIAFPRTSHYEVWDMDHETHIVVPALLCLMAKDPLAWVGTTLSLPDVTFLDLRCDGVPLPSRMSLYDPSQQYTTRHVGRPQYKPRSTTAYDDETPPSRIKDEAIRSHNIALDGDWMRTYSKPSAIGPLHILRRADMANAFTHAAAAVLPDTKYERGWFLRIWVPIPTRLFAKRETLLFNIDARIWMMGDEERVLSLDVSHDQAHPLDATSQMSVSHLRTPREMDNVYWC